MALPGNKNFSDYDNYVTDQNPTTSAQAQDYFRNQAELLKAVIDCDFWQPETVYQSGDVVKSDSMPNGTEAVMVATKAGVTSNVEPQWGAVGGANISDGACFWKLRWQHWSKEVEQITELNTGATNRLPNKSYAVGNVVYDKSNLSVALKCTQAGTTSNTELDISGRAVGNTVTDGRVVWEIVPRFLPAETINEIANELMEELFVGFIGIYAGNTPPNGWLDCSGASLNPQTYTRLFGRIGTIYGGDGNTTFNLPNLNNNSFLEGSDVVGTVKSAGSPNIKGYIHYLYPSADIGFSQESDGALFWAGISNRTPDKKQAEGWGSVGIDASRSSSIYRDDITTVQPKSVTVKFCIKY